MLSARKYVCPVLGGIALIAGALGCGSSTTNNDQGAAFSALGYFSSLPPPEPPPAVAGVNAALATDISTSVFGQQLILYLGVENRLRNQYIRATKIDCDYSVPGADIKIPSDSMPVSAFVNASPGIGGPQIGGSGGSGGVGSTNAVGGSTGSTGGSSTGSGSGGSGNNLGGASASGGPATGTGSKAYIGFQVVSPAIYAFLNNNRQSLPELPFQMQAYCSVTGVSLAGDAYETNPVGLWIVFHEPSEFPDSDTPGTGTGGDFDSFDGSDTGSSGNNSTTTGSTSSSGLAEGEGTVGAQ